MGVNFMEISRFLCGVTASEIVDEVIRGSLARLFSLASRRELAML